MNVELIMDNFREFLSEALSGDIYHFTHIESLEKILSTNKFLTSVAVSSDEKGNRGKFYFFSIARSRTTHFISAIPEFGAVMIILDSEKLNSRFKIVPVDYWGQQYKQRGESETEERVLTDSPYIKNAIDYIKEIHISFSMSEYTHVAKSEVESILNIGVLAQERQGIPTYYYFKEGTGVNKDWLMLRRGRALTDPREVVETIKHIKGEDIKDVPGGWQIKEKNKDLEAYAKIFSAILLNNKEEIKKLEKVDYIGKKIYNIKYHPRDAKEEIPIIIRSQRKKIKDRDSIHTIFSSIRKSPEKSIDSFIDFARKKLIEWRDEDAQNSQELKEINIEKLNNICYSGGSTHIMKTCKIGEDEYYLKFSNEELFGKTNPSLQILIEYLSYKIYSLYPEIKIPKVELVWDKKNKKVGLASSKIKGKPGVYINPDKLAKMLSAGVYVDVFLANWDVIGTGEGNIIVDKDQATRIDPGGSLTFRAQGGRKGKKFDSKTKELSTMLKGNSGAGNVYQYADLKEAGKVFLNVSFEQIRQQMIEVNREIVGGLKENNLLGLLKEWKPDIISIAKILKERHREILNHIKFIS